MGRFCSPQVSLVLRCTTRERGREGRREREREREREGERERERERERKREQRGTWGCLRHRCTTTMGRFLV
jgi:hypothetical protein